MNNARNLNFVTKICSNYQVDTTTICLGSEWVHTCAVMPIMEMQYVDGQHKHPTGVEVFQDPHDMDRSIYPVIDCVLNVAHFYTDFVFVPGVAAFDECPKKRQRFQG